MSYVLVCFINPGAFVTAVLVAEVIAHFLPRMVELHNYNAASSLAQKKVNWQTLNKRVFSKMGMRINDQVVAALIEAKPGIIEKVREHQI